MAAPKSNLPEKVQDTPPVALRIGDPVRFHCAAGVWRPALVIDLSPTGAPTLRVFGKGGDASLPGEPGGGVSIRRVTPYPCSGGMHAGAIDWEVAGARKGLGVYCWRP